MGRVKVQFMVDEETKRKLKILAASSAPSFQGFLEGMCLDMVADIDIQIVTKPQDKGKE